MTGPSSIGIVTPTYPADARLARIEGAVELEAVIDTTGVVTDVRVVRSLDARFGLARAQERLSAA